MLDLGYELDYINFDGLLSSDFDIWVSGEQTFNGTKRDVEDVVIPGRNGTLTLDNGRMENVTITYGCACLKDAGTKISAFRDALSEKVGFLRLQDSFHPAEFRIARFSGTINPTMGAFKNGGVFNVAFDCYPQRFLLTGEEIRTFDADAGIENPTLHDSKPWIRVYGSGSIGLGTETITILSNNYPYIDIDSETQECTYDAINCNDLVSFTGDTFPVLHPGTNGVTLNGVTCEIKGRWFNL